LVAEIAVQASQFQGELRGPSPFRVAGFVRGGGFDHGPPSGQQVLQQPCNPVA